MFNSRNKSGISKHPCIFCLLYKGQSLKSDNFYRKAIIGKAIIFTCEIIIDNLTCEIISFISVLEVLFNKRAGVFY
jgi:hypothetical protein